MDKIVLASNNKGKLKEFQQLFSANNTRVIPQSHFRIEDAEETGLSFVENAIIKARHAARISGLPALADDSGLEVDALRGRPGIFSARFSGEHATDDQNNAKLLKLMQDVPTEHRTARFQCVLALMRHVDDPTPLIFQGTWEGHILFEAQGKNGFGYDPLFFAAEQRLASAELLPEVKNQVSHRAKAVSQLVKLLKL